MIYITGDTHGDHDFYKIKAFVEENKNLNKQDYLIIAGDFGAVWDKKTLKEDLKPYVDLPLTILFVDGNHENFQLLNSYPVQMWNGGKVHIIADNIIHLMRGQVFTIEGKTIFTFGGASSTDKMWRIEGLSWWKEENPTYEEFDEAINNLNKYDNNVDYIVTHTCDEKALYQSPLRASAFKPYPENRMFSYFEDNVEYKHWYFGHYHMDGDLSSKKTVLYNEIREI